MCIRDSPVDKPRKQRGIRRREVHPCPVRPQTHGWSNTARQNLDALRFRHTQLGRKPAFLPVSRPFARPRLYTIMPTACQAPHSPARPSTGTRKLHPTPMRPICRAVRRVRIGEAFGNVVYFTEAESDATAQDALRHAPTLRAPHRRIASAGHARISLRDAPPRKHTDRKKQANDTMSLTLSLIHI